MAEFSPAGIEAERRISFFVQSLTTEIPQPIPVDATGMPTFSEKVSGREPSSVTLSELVSFRLYCPYARSFVKKTRILVLRFSNTQSSFTQSNGRISSKTPRSWLKSRRCSTASFPNNEKGESKTSLLLPRFPEGVPEFILRTRRSHFGLLSKIRLHFRHDELFEGNRAYRESGSCAVVCQH